MTRALDGPLKPLVYRAAHRRVLAQTSGNYPAPLEILKVVRRGLGRSLARGLEREAECFGRLTMTSEHRALTHVFFAGRASKTDLKAEPRAVRQVGILGGGLMGSGIATICLNEAFKLLEDGLSIDDLDRFAQRMGFPVGPCTVLDEIGLDVADKVAGVMVAFFGERVESTDHNLRFMQDNRLGRKNGRGFYVYEGGKRGKVDKSVYQLLDNPQRKDIPYEEVRDRLLGIILNEAAYALAEGLIENASVGDIGAIFGFGFPPFLGGPYWAMDQIGLPAFTEQLQRLAERHGSRFTPAPGLVQRAEAGERYHPRP